MRMMCAVIFSSLLFASAVRAEPWSWGPVPAGIEQDSAAREAEATDKNLHDLQILEGPDSHVEFNRTVDRIRGPEGSYIGTSFQSINFDPRYERIVFHWVRVLAPGGVREIRVEPSLVGEMCLLIKDIELHQGESLDAAWSRVGKSSSMRGAAFGSIDRNFRGKNGDHCRIRLVWNRPEPLVVTVGRNVAVPRESKSPSGQRIVDWQGNIWPADSESLHKASDWIEWTGLKDWAGVGRWLAALFPRDAATSPEAQQLAKEALGAGPSQEARILRLYGTIADYFNETGLEASALSPSLQETFRRAVRLKAGSPLEKAALLLASLRAMGLEGDVLAVPGEDLSLGGQAPRPFGVLSVFVVRVFVDSSRKHCLYLDPTAKLSPSEIRDHYPRHSALLVAADSPGLIRLPDWRPERPDVQLDLSVDASVVGKEASLAWVLTDRVQPSQLANNASSILPVVVDNRWEADLQVISTRISTDSSEAVAECRSVSESFLAPMAPGVDSGSILLSTARDVIAWIRKDMELHVARQLPVDLRGTIRVRLPAGSLDRDTARDSAVRGGLAMRRAQWVRDGVAGIDWSLTSSYVEIPADSAELWKAVLDSATSMCQIRVVSDRRPMAQRIRQWVTPARAALAGGTALLLVVVGVLLGFLRMRGLAAKRASTTPVK